MTAASIYRSINAVARQLAKTGLAKSHVNEVDGYSYRSIDDLLDALAPLFAKHGICVLPRMLHREVTERRDDGHLLIHVALRSAFDLVSTKDGSAHVVEAFGEALDAGDKATAKAATAAFKSAMTQAFCIPFAGSKDADAASYRVAASTHSGEPIGGWDQWCREIEDVVSVCETDEAICLVQDRHRELLKGLSRERPNLYRELGEAFTSRRETHSRRKTLVEGAAPRSHRCRNNDAEEGAAHA